MGFGMLFLVLAHLLQERQSLILQSRKLKKQSGIEHYVGILLIRENPFFFSRSHTGPTAYGFLRRVSAIFVVPYNAAQKAVVGCGNVIVVVEMYRCECLNIYSDLFFFINLLRKFGIERMNTLYDENHIVFVLNMFLAFLALTRMEIISRQFHLISCDNIFKVMGKQRNVKRINALEIIFSNENFKK